MARRTFAEYKADVLHALGNPAEAGMTISPTQIVNDALEHLAAMHPWNWLSTGESSLNVVADQAYVALPADFGILTAISHENAWTKGFWPTTWDRLLELRRGTIVDAVTGYWYVLNFGSVDPAHPELGLGVPRLELYPTPAASATAAIYIVYLRFLRRLSATTDVPQWPSYMDRPLSLLARGFAKTDYDDDPESAYTQEFRTMIQDCLTRDGLSIKSFGQGRSGVYPGMPVDPMVPTSIGDPTEAS